MMRLPLFQHRVPATLAEAARTLAGDGPDAMLLAGGTDLLPNMKRRQQMPRTLVSLTRVAELKHVNGDAGLTLGAGLTLSEVVAIDRLRDAYRGFRQAAAQVASPHLRNMGTLGGNLCLDTRCNYYNQNEDWRTAIGYCMKCQGKTCWVATGSKRCVAVSSTDTAPALISLGARVRLVSSQGERELDLADLYQNDGIDHLARRPDEILATVTLPDRPGWRSCYWKLRRRGSFDFPLLGVAAAARFATDGTIEEARLVLGAVASKPIVAEKAAAYLVGRKIDDETLAEAGRLAGAPAKPMDNTDLDVQWRKRVVPAFVGYALRELRGDDMRATRLIVSRQSV